MLEERLFKFIEGEVEMSRTQVYAATRLLDKVLPSLRAVEVSSTEPDTRNPRDMSHEELLISLYRSPDGKELIQEVLNKWRSEILGQKSI